MEPRPELVSGPGDGYTRTEAVIEHDHGDRRRSVAGSDSQGTSVRRPPETRPWRRCHPRALEVCPITWLGSSVNRLRPGSIGSRFHMLWGRGSRSSPFLVPGRIPERGTWARSAFQASKSQACAVLRPEKTTRHKGFCARTTRNEAKRTSPTSLAAVMSRMAWAAAQRVRCGRALHEHQMPSSRRGGRSSHHGGVGVVWAEDFRELDSLIPCVYIVP
jgi:hypothetical protein